MLQGKLVCCKPSFLSPTPRFTAMGRWLNIVVFFCRGWQIAAVIVLLPKVSLLLASAVGNIFSSLQLQLETNYVT